MVSSAPYDPQNSHHFVVSSFHLVVLWIVLWMALWMVLVRELVRLMVPETEPEKELETGLFLLTFGTSLSMPHRHHLRPGARAPVWVLAMAPPKSLSVSPSQVDKSTSAYRSRSQRLADHPTLAALTSYLAPSVPLFCARVFSDQSRAGAVSSALSLYRQSSWWSTTGMRQLRQ
jgi:hypothetical protein